MDTLTTGRRSPSSRELDVLLGARLRAQRVLRRMSQTALGESVGLTFQQVQKYEKGINRISTARLIELSQALDFSITHFLEAVIDTNEQPDEEAELLTKIMNSPQVTNLARDFSEIRSEDVRNRIAELVANLNRVQDKRE